MFQSSACTANEILREEQGSAVACLEIKKHALRIQLNIPVTV